MNDGIHDIIFLKAASNFVRADNKLYLHHKNLSTENSFLKLELVTDSPVSCKLLWFPSGHSTMHTMHVHSGMLHKIWEEYQFYVN